MPNLLSLLRRGWESSPTRAQAVAQGFRIFWFCAALFAVGLVFVLIAAGPKTGPTAVLYAFGFLLIGALTGFLFGIPKVYTHSSDTGTAAAAGTSPAPLSQQLLRVNTNLEQISDWLTKIIVGIGLVQLAKVPGYITNLTWFFADRGLKAGAGGSVTNAEGLVLGIALYFPALGFFAGYLTTRIVLASVFNAADQELLPPQLRAQVVTSPTLSFEEPQNDVDPVAKSAAQRIASIPISQLATIDDITAWSRAQLYLGNFERAAAGYLQATLLDPNNPAYHQRYALALFNRKAPIEDVISQLLTAYALATDGTGKPLPNVDPQVMAATFENLTLTYLYVPPPDGFRQAIAYGTRALGIPRVARERVLYYLAAAYGQQYAWVKQNAGTIPDAPAELSAAQNAAVEKATAAIAADPTGSTIKKLLQYLATGNDPNEDDLKEVYADTPALRAVLA
jgi:hypothetical protein